MEDGQPSAYMVDAFTAFIPFANEKNNNFVKDVRLNIRIPKYSGYRGLNPIYEHNPPMDTGSTGLAISARDLGYTEEEQLDQLLGSYFGLLPDAKVSARIRILAVTFKGICLDFNESTGKCDRISAGLHFPPEICYLGIGFGRWSKHQPGGTVDKNALLNIVEANNGITIARSNIHQGYVITDTGVWVGLTESNTRDFRSTKLSPKPGANPAAQSREWNGPKVFIDYRGSLHAGTALFDTGIAQSYLSTPVFQDCHRLPAGEQYTIKIGNQADHPIHILNVTVDDFTEPITPSYVRASPRSPVFINTGRFFYRIFDLLFDVEEGWLGLRTREPRNLPGIYHSSVSLPRERSSRPGAERRDSDEAL